MTVSSHELPSLDPVIDGERVALDGPPVEVFDPSSGAVLCTFADVGEAGVDRAVRAAREGFRVWSTMTYRERSDRLLAFIDAFQERREEFGRLEAIDVGKPFAAAIREVDGCADRLRYFTMAARMMSVPNSGNFRDAVMSHALRQPVGVVGAITPWNYPMGLLTWKIGPALAVGNSVVAKPAPETPLTTLLMAEVAAEFLPPGVFNVITGEGQTTGDALVRHPRVPMISMTGATATGKIIMAAAAERVKKLHLELGGPSAVLVFDDADLARFEAVLPKALFRNSGQDCHALSRVYVHEARYDDVIELATRAAAEQTLGGPFDAHTCMGPLVSQRQRERVAGLVDRAVADGARVATGAEVPERPGYFYPATILHGVGPGSGIKQEEIFGPVMTITPFRDEERVLTWANESPFGLSASVWTADLDRAMRVSRALEVGTVWVNDHSTTVTEMPFGGWKESGIGREMSLEVLEEHTELKHIGFGVKPR